MAVKTKFLRILNRPLLYPDSADVHLGALGHTPMSLWWGPLHLSRPSLCRSFLTVQLQGVLGWSDPLVNPKTSQYSAFYGGPSVSHDRASATLSLCMFSIFCGKLLVLTCSLDTIVPRQINTLLGHLWTAVAGLFISTVVQQAERSETTKLDW